MRTSLAFGLLFSLVSLLGSAQPHSHSQARRSRHRRSLEPISRVEAHPQALAARAATSASGNGHWSVYQTSDWVADPTSIAINDLAAVAIETVYVTVTAFDDGSSAAATSATIASSSVSAATAVVTSSASSFASAIDLSQSSDPIDTFVSTASNADELVSLSLGVGITLGGGSSTSAIASATATTITSAATSTSTTGSSSSSSSSSSDKNVFAHFMVGIVSTYVQSDWEADMTLAKSKSIDGFALNIGVDSYSQSQLDLAYSAAANVGFSLFISFDFNWYSTSNVSGVADMLKRYIGQTAQFKVDGKPFVSTFIGDGFDWSATATAVGQELYAVPYWAASADNANNAGLSGLFSWDAWPGQINNVPVDTVMSNVQDLTYISLTQAAGKTYMAPVSTWFSTHFGSEVSYSKNWVFKSETLWKDRWDQILSMGSSLNFVEIVTWNDYGESHYIGPYNTPHTDDGSSKWAAGLDHTAMLDFAVPYIKAFKAGATSVTVDEEMLVYWHRPHLKGAKCDSTDVCAGPPTGYDFLSDSVFVATMTKSGGSVSVTSGSNAAVTQLVDSGVQIFEVPMGTGTQSFTFTTKSGGSATGFSNVTISADCWNGIYNFNYHSGSLIIS